MNGNNKNKPVVKKNDIVMGIIVGTIIIILITLFVFVMLEEYISSDITNVIDWILPPVLLLGGLFLILTNIPKNANTKKGMFIGGIIVSVLSIVAITFKIIGWL